MTHKIAIVGAGQAGMPLALSLLAAGRDVTLVTNRTADDVRRGKVMSSQCLFGTSLQIERDANLDFWEQECPLIEGIGLTVPHPEQPGQKLIDWAARLDRPAQSVDQRLKLSDWMDLFTHRGGKLEVKEVGIGELEHLTATHDLVVVAAGKGDVVKLFERDEARSPYQAPQRTLALTYVHGMAPRTPYSRVCFNLIPGIGEYFVFPALAPSGPCEIMVFEGIPGGPMDCWDDVRTPRAHLQRSLSILQTFLPWEHARCADVELTDANGVLAGRVTPAVRKPVGRLPSGRLVFGMADAVTVNDPITGQGSNNAVKAFKVVNEAIQQRGDAPFDAAWMQATFDRCWDDARHATRWTNMLLAPPPPHILNLLGAAGQCPPIASVIANCFDQPKDLFPWWADPAVCEAFIADHMAVPA
ncbi:MAG: hypothetical protein RLZZ618_1332 [Pseudomonadota bacterium]|jgi:2-polyprenyl-6-methoxyphenol hydroxylase-like FAD-dependent oxidoreductase